MCKLSNCLIVTLTPPPPYDQGILTHRKPCFRTHSACIGTVLSCFLQLISYVSTVLSCVLLTAVHYVWYREHSFTYVKMLLLGLTDENIQSDNSANNNDCTYLLNYHCCDAGLT